MQYTAHLLKRSAIFEEAAVSKTRGCEGNNAAWKYFRNVNFATNEIEDSVAPAYGASIEIARLEEGREGNIDVHHTTTWIADKGEERGHACLFSNNNVIEISDVRCYS